MDLKNYLETHSDISLFDSARDNAAVLEFMEKSAMRIGGIELLYDRAPEFIRLLKCQGARFFTFIGKNKDRQIMGFFSMSFSTKWIQGQKKSCGYIGDFRTDGSRASAVTWRRAYAELLTSVQNEESLGQPVYFLTAILKKNVEALRSLTGGKKALGFRYDFLKEIDMVNVYGMFPWKKVSSLKVQQAGVNDLTALKSFLNEKEQSKLFGSVFDGSSDDCWSHRQNTWNGFALENFLLIKDDHGHIQACTLPWDPDFAKRMTVVKAPATLKLVFKLLSAFGFNMPSVGESLRTTYLTHLNFSKSIKKDEALRAFLSWTFQNNKSAHMVSFPDSTGLSKNLKDCVIQRIPVMLYSVSLAETAKLELSSEVGFEMGLV